MAQLENSDKNLIIRLELLPNGLDVEGGRPDTENWIPFALSLVSDGQERCAIPESLGATLSVYETRHLIEALSQIVKEKAHRNTIQTFEFYSCEAYFELDVYDVLEPDSVGVSLWLNMGALSNGQVYGYDQGYRFNANVTDLKRFTETLQQQLRALLP